ncbi:MAG TPA: hypothetical protein VMD59_05715 [Acidimicrobiales bacterium]|nr:hypothetical protein [Acidimicrobiales bacterium]
MGDRVAPLVRISDVPVSGARGDGLAGVRQVVGRRLVLQDLERGGVVERIVCEDRCCLYLGVGRPDREEEEGGAFMS